METETRVQSQLGFRFETFFVRPASVGLRNRPRVTHRPGLSILLTLCLFFRSFGVSKIKNKTDLNGSRTPELEKNTININTYFNYFLITSFIQ